MKKIAILTLLLCFLLQVSCLAADVSKIKWEIGLGNDLVWSTCLGQENPYKMYRDINNLLDQRKKNGTDTDGFLLGAYYAACIMMDMAIESRATPEQEKQFFKASLNFYYKHFREKQQLLDLNDHQFSEALGIQYEIVKNLLNKWDFMVNGKATSSMK